MSMYMAALEASIINQTSLKDVGRLMLPIHIFYGAFDPVIIRKHIVQLGVMRKNITTKKLLAGHEVQGVYAKSVASYLSTIQS